MKESNGLDASDGILCGPFLLCGIGDGIKPPAGEKSDRSSCRFSGMIKPLVFLLLPYFIDTGVSAASNILPPFLDVAFLDLDGFWRLFCLPFLPPLFFKFVFDVVCFLLAFLLLRFAAGALLALRFLLDALLVFAHIFVALCLSFFWFLA